MQTFFSPDSKLMQTLGRLSDLMGLNLLFLLTCLPIFTVGASTAALYTVCFRFDTERENGVVKPYFRAFRENFKKSTLVWLILLAVELLLIFDSLMFLGHPGWMGYLPVLFLALYVFAAMTMTMAFPLMSQFENSLKGTLRNALLLAVGFAPRVLLLTLLNLLPMLLYLFLPYWFLRIGVVFVLLYGSAVAYLGAKLLGKVMDRLKEQPAEETE